MPQSEKLSRFLDFNIDNYLSPYIPHNRLYLLPKPVSRWLGYRSEEHHEPPNLFRWPITFLATVASLCLVGGIMAYSPGLEEWHPPVLIASLGATAVLDFNFIRSPLSQPRNTVIGNTIAALCGVGISKLFQHSADFANISWVSAAVACAVTNFAMEVTGTVHPPGGATAVLASVDAAVITMGWKYVPVVLLSSTLMVIVALMFNNIMRQYPVYWWAPGPVGSKLRGQQSVEKTAEEGELSAPEARKSMSDASSERTLRREFSHGMEYTEDIEGIRISPSQIQLPRSIQLDERELAVLHKLRRQLAAKS